jgi:hypothetical protein
VLVQQRLSAADDLGGHTANMIANAIMMLMFHANSMCSPNADRFYTLCAENH